MADPVDVPEIAADGLLLRPWRTDPHDVAALVRICTDPAVARWTGGPSAYGADDALAFVAKRRRQAEEGATAAWAVTDGGAVVGSVQLSRLAEDHPEVGFTVAPEARGRAVSRRAVTAACRWAFARGAPKVLWLAEVGNEASWKVAHQVGFAYEGRRRAELPQAGRGRVDAWSAGLLPADLDVDHPLPWFPDPVLTDGPVTVRRYREDDLDAWLPLRNETDVVRRGHGGRARRALSRDEAWENLLVAGVEERMTGGGMALAITVDGVVAGDIGFHRFNGGADIGWWLGAAHRGHGVAGTAAVLVIDHLRASGAVDRIEARIHRANVGSQRVAERAGLARVGVCVRDAPWDGDVLEDGYLYGCAVP